MQMHSKQTNSKQTVSDMIWQLGPVTAYDVKAKDYSYRCKAIKTVNIVQLYHPLGRRLIKDILIAGLKLVFYTTFSHPSILGLH